MAKLFFDFAVEKAFLIMMQGQLEVRGLHVKIQKVENLRTEDK